MENKKKTAIIFVGIQASGKSTFYQERFKDYVHINLDTLHTRNKENILLQECMEQGTSFVIDNTNPTREDREKYICKAKAAGYMVLGYYFQSSVSECIARNEQREGKAKVPNRAVAATHRKLELPKYDEGFDRLFYVHIKDDGFVVEDWDDEDEK